MPQRVGAVLVVGAGVGGIRAALDLAESGFRVYLADSSPSLGGSLSQLDQWFPDNNCEMCKLLPAFSRDECSQFCLHRDLAHPNIELISGAEVQELQGEAGDFQATLTVKSRRVKPERCTACALCAGVCPVEVADEFEEGLRKRKAVYVRNPLSIPNVYAIDRANCTQCGKCVDVCPTGAIDLSLPDESRQLNVGAVIVSTGMSEFDAASMGQYGFGRYPNVVSNVQLERMLSRLRSGGQLVRPSDGRTPNRIAFLQCVGSRDLKRSYCSAACCMYALKEAAIIKRRNPDADVTVFYMDLRAFGKGYHQYYEEVKRLGVKFVPCRVSALKQNPRTRGLTALARGDDGLPVESEFDLVVLSVAQCPSPRVAELAGILSVSVNRWGFFKTPELSQVNTDRNGIYVCGSAAGPVDISETVTQASAAACQASILLSAARNQLVARQGEIPPAPVADPDVDSRVAVFLCRCGKEVSSVVDIEKVASRAKRFPGVVQVEEVDYLCLPEALDRTGKAVTDSQANRVVFAACAPYYHQRLFERAIEDTGLDRSQTRLVNIREQIAWVHKDSQAMATDKAGHAVAAAVEQVRQQERSAVPSAPVNQRGLVIGGSLAGLVAALSLAEQGFEVHLVEEFAELGGTPAPGDSAAAFHQETIRRIKDNPLAHVHSGAALLEVTGQAGDFHVGIKAADGTAGSIDCGAVIVATGAGHYEPTDYLYSQDDRIVTQGELGERLAGQGVGQPSTVVMVQCVGSRDGERPYCSRTCCTDAVLNAIRIKEQSPQTQVFILYRDVMTYGFREEHYSRAREAGVLFLRYHPDRKPNVVKRDGILVVQVDSPIRYTPSVSVPGREWDSTMVVRLGNPIAGGKLEIDADLLVLSTGKVPGDNRELARILSLELTGDGFFRELDTKFRPVDSTIDGIFVCGPANSPRGTDEEITQAQAAAQRAATVLAKDKLRSGRLVAEVNLRRCSGCALCVANCPYGARALDEERRVAVVKEVLCQGCGACVAICPNGASKLRGLSEKQVFSMIEAAL